jgi:hypothetical protein
LKKQKQYEEKYGKDSHLQAKKKRLKKITPSKPPEGNPP